MNEGIALSFFWVFFRLCIWWDTFSNIAPSLFLKFFLLWKSRHSCALNFWQQFVFLFFSSLNIVLFFSLRLTPSPGVNKNNAHHKKKEIKKKEIIFSFSSNVGEIEWECVYLCLCVLFACFDCFSPALKFDKGMRQRSRRAAQLIPSFYQSILIPF